MKIKVTEATLTQLDWLVATALGFRPAVWRKTSWGRELVPAPGTQRTNRMDGASGIH